MKLSLSRLPRYLAIITTAFSVAPHTHAEGDFLNGCPAKSHFAGQIQHDCTVYRALIAHGGGGDHDALQQTCKGRVCTYREKPIRGRYTYDSWKYGEWDVIYHLPYYAD